MNLKNKRILVTGAAGLIGAAVASAVSEYGGELIAADVRDGYLRMDLSDEVSIKKAMSEVLGRPLHGLVHCAYPRTPDWGARFEDVSMDSLRKNVDMQMNAVFLICQMVAEHMHANEGGSIVTIGSMHGVVAPNFHVYEDTPMTSAAGYSLVKGGIIHFTKYLASYYGAHNVRVNCVSPGGIWDNQNPVFVERYKKYCPMERMGKPEEISGPVVFLLSEEASYITGHNLVVDGGWTIC